MKKTLIILTIFFLTTSCSKLNIFGFGEKKNQYEKFQINEYLWKATDSILSSYTDTDTNLKDGLIKTDWIPLKKSRQKARIKITVYIIGSSLTKNNLEVSSEKQLYINDKWENKNTSVSFNEKLKTNIFIRATKKAGADGKI
tara:strand:- start:774 stop:1199 length:426 start_codon:yes stop_codon:yes gene_type:complete